MTRFDAIVIGAGPAGATAALALARQGRAVALVEKSAFPRYKVCGEFMSGPAWRVLDALGMADALRADAGPPVTAVGLWHREAMLRTIPSPHAVGRALGRHVLDAALAAAAESAGAMLFQPCKARGLVRVGEAWRVDLESANRLDSLENAGRADRVADEGAMTPESITAPVVIAAHGSWEAGALPTQIEGVPRRPLLGFKARFLDARLPSGLMPLVVFPGGYGGLVHSDGGAVSFSLCIRADVLARCRKAWPGHSAGEAAFRHACANVRGVREALGDAHTERPWMGAGPIRPGFRDVACDGLFRVGNAAGEAHPLVAEGISMAIESAGVLASALQGWDGTAAALAPIERDYRRNWRRTVAHRIVASFALERVMALAPGAVIAMAQRLPGAFAWAARWSGKGRFAAA